MGAADVDSPRRGPSSFTCGDAKKMKPVGVDGDDPHCVGLRGGEEQDIDLDHRDCCDFDHDHSSTGTASASCPSSQFMFDSISMAASTFKSPSTPRPVRLSFLLSSSPRLFQLFPS